jgi:cell wall-associated NlpC family hydrolase
LTIALAAGFVSATGVGCGRQSAATGAPASSSASIPVATSPGATTDAAAPRAHPQAIEPVAGAAAAGRSPGASSSDVAGVSVGPVSSTLPQPTSDAEVRRQLTRSGMTASPDQATLTPGGLAVAPIGAPAAVQEVIAAGNTIARLPYRYGGGHMTYEDTAYDCSGSISYAFAAAHLLDHTVASGELENWGRPGPGKWITVFANAGHTFMYVAGLRFDTVALAETGSRWSDRSADEPDLKTFSVRHPAGL